ncbi:hypothetical protein F4824DRAFT_74941 [Ustulina deusta]|nr:hypothetical protein F4824DRAFT_74941 [Ustulina deusta]
MHLDASSYYILADPVYCAPPGDTTQPNQPTDAGQSTSTRTSQGSKSTAPSGVSSDITTIKVGASLGSVLGLVLLSALGYFLLTWYRRKRLAARHLPLHSDFFKMKNEVAEVKNSSKSRLSHREQHPRRPWSTHVKLNRMSGYVELEGTPVEEPGPGIYVFKPELEGTAGTPGLRGVYVRKKSELFADSRETSFRVMRSPVGETFESPILGHVPPCS